MLGDYCRPSGEFDWLLARTAPKPWSVLACLATEERCVALWQKIYPKGLVHSASFIDITNPKSEFRGEVEIRKNIRKSEIQTIGNPSLGFPKQRLFSTNSDIVDCIDSFLATSSPNVILDISCFPKRFFFPFVHRLLSSSKIQNCIATYTIPRQYPDHDLAEQHGPLDHLPFFGPRSYDQQKQKVDVLIVGVGFLPLGIERLLMAHLQEKKTDIEMLLSFPAAPQALRRNWNFWVHLVDGTRLENKSPTRLDGHDVSDVFDHINAITDYGVKTAVFAPYGPKPMSLAMCLYARLTNSVAYYTQPRTYHPDYSIGIERCDAFCLRLNGTDLYKVEGTSPSVNTP
jgi:hypothetical protein